MFSIGRLALMYASLKNVCGFNVSNTTIVGWISLLQKIS